MGSTGTGRLTDYHRNKSAIPGVTGGESLINACEKAIATELEDVPICDYYKTHGAVPPKGTPLLIRFDVRIVAVDDKGLIIGYLPTKYNYLFGCLESGYAYSGEVAASYDKPVPTVYIAATPSRIP